MARNFAKIGANTKPPCCIFHVILLGTTTILKKLKWKHEYFKDLWINLQHIIGLRKKGEIV